METIPKDNAKDTAPEDIKRAIGSLLNQGFSQEEVRELIEKINQTYFEAAQPDWIKAKLPAAIREQELILNRPLTNQEKDSLVRQLRDQGEPAN